MQNAYVTSTLYSLLTTRASVFNDYSYLLNTRFDRGHPIHSSLVSNPACCVCCCDNFCVFLSPRVPIRPCYLYGSRQLSLIQLGGGSRRLISGGRDRIRRCETGSNRCEVYRGVAEIRGGRRGRKGRCRCGVDEEEESEVSDSESFGDVEAVLSLLCEEVGEESYVRERNGFRRMKVEDRRRRRNVGLSKRVEDESKWSSSGSGRRNAGLSKRVEEESVRSLGGGRRNVSLSSRIEEQSRSNLGGRDKGEGSAKGGDKIESVSKGVQVDFDENDRFERGSREKRSNGRYSYMESNSKLRSETTRVEFSENDSRQREETGMLVRVDSHGGRKEGSSGSSYHSLSSSGDFDARNNHGLLEEPGLSKNQDSKYDRGGYNERIREEHRNHRDDGEAGSELSKHTSNVVEGSSMWDWRKKSEKKFTEVAIEETRSSKRSSEMHSRVKKTNESELTKASRLQKYYDDERENSDQAWRTKEQYSQTGNQVLEAESRRTFQEGKEKLEVHRTDTETTSQSQQKRSDKATSTTTVQETSDDHYRKTGRITEGEDINIDIQKFTRISQVQVVDTDLTSKSSTRISTFQEKDLGYPSSFQASTSVVSQPRMQREDADNRRPEAPMLTPHPQLITRGPVRVQLSSETASQDGNNSVVIYESSGGNSNTESPVEISYPGNPEASTSEDNGMETVPGAQWGPGGTMPGRRAPSQYASEDSQLKRNESRCTSRGSGSKGPSIEMWDVTDTPTLESPEEENQVATSTGEKSETGTASEKHEATIPSGKLESTTSGNVIAKRTGRSIWNLVGDIVKMRWSPRAETGPDAVRPGEKIISTESASSEAWLSGRETEGSSQGNVKWDNSLQPETTVDQLQPVKSFSQTENTSATVKGKEKVRYLETGMTSSTYKEGRTLTSEESVSLSSGEEISSPKYFETNLPGSSSDIQLVRSTYKEGRTLTSEESVSLSSGEEISSPKYFETNLPGSSSDIQLVGSSQPQVATGVKSPVVKETSNAGYTMPGSSSEENKDRFGQKFDDESDNVQNMELKQRKLQRNRQVPKDRFDEWEEAHTREMEQRKNDEFFMREALVEAKKAADTWEVPVGAVLVQHGKIIARGFNLVEELRDSTAHAEMICIREASNVLRTWRLAECTLYVTLEPCPMCAGAIYQARVDTVVWGAPNKLLGADGSWIRLFPDGGQGIESECSNKPAAPVHPFHPNITIRRGVLASECADIMQQFFQLRRRKKEKQSTPPAPELTHIVAHHPRKILTKLHDIFHVMFCL